MPEEMTGAQALIESLRRQKVDVIFGIPGGSTLPIYDVLYDSDIRHILTKHEQCAAHMADGYARASGRAGVCMATSGPGATNLVTGIANAYMDSVPMVALTGQVPKNLIGKDAFQEADIIGITTPITKYTFQARSVTEIPSIVKKAFYIATTGRPGPVLIDLPKDTQTESGEVDFDVEVKLRGYRPTYDPHPVQVKKAADMLANAERPFILAGGGVITSNASEELRSIAEMLGAAVSTSLMGKGSFPENHPLFAGAIGMHGTREAHQLIMEADVLLCVGIRFSDRTTGKLDEFCPEAKIIQIDIDSAEINKNAIVDLPIVADAKRALKAIISTLIEKSRRGNTVWTQRIEQVKKELKYEPKNHGEINPPSLLARLRKLLPQNAIVSTEVGQNQMWTRLYFESYLPRTFISSGGLGTMGFGFPAAIGAKVACPDRTVVDIAGDGSFIMTGHDMATSVIEEIPVIVVILNNNMLGMIAQWQRLFYKHRYSAAELHGIPDFVRWAEAFGAAGVRVESMGGFEDAVKKAIKSDVTTIIDVPISPEENVFPMVPAGKAIKDIMVEP